MKKIFTVILAAMCFSAAAEAAELKDIKAEFNFSSGGAEISGSISAEKGSAPIGAVIYYNDKVAAAAQTAAARARADGGYKFEFEPIKLPFSAEDGTYTVEVFSDIANSSVKAEFTYEGPQTVYNNIEKIIGYAADKNQSAFTEFFSGRAKAFSNMNADGKKIFFEFFSDCEYTLPENADTYANKEKVFDEAAKIYNDYTDVYIPIASFSQIGSAYGVGAYLDEFSDKCGVYLDDEKTDFDETLYNRYIKKAKGSASYQAAVAGYSNVLDFKGINNILRKEALLNVIYEGNAVEFKEIVDTFPDEFSLSGTAFSKLGKNDKAKAYASVGGKKYASFDEVSRALEMYAENIKKTSGGSSGTSSGGSSGGGSKSAPIEVKINTPAANNEAADTNDMLFEDISKEHWAYNAVKYLYDRKIVNGRSEKSFSPKDPVTRAEFVKMAVCALGFDTDGAVSSFADVDGSEWFAPFVNAAYVKGMITGDESNCFNPSMPVTRQDMAVILSRALALGGGRADFSDAGEIAPYALGAVGAMKENGLINGYDGGLFKPCASADRAETAQIIYNVLKWRSNNEKG